MCVTGCLIKIILDLHPPWSRLRFGVGLVGAARCLELADGVWTDDESGFVFRVRCVRRSHFAGANPSPYLVLGDEESVGDLLYC